MIDCKKLTLEDTQKILAAAQAHAAANNWAVTIAVADNGGHLLGLQRADKAPVMSSIIAADKAHASALSGRPTKGIEDMINNGRVAAVNMPIVGLEGGEPIIVDGQVIGAVGVSGVAANQDAEIAQAGIAALGIV